MANTVVEINVAASGLTGLKLGLYAAPGGDALLNAGGLDDLAERANAKGVYFATVTEAVVGFVRAIVYLSDGTTPIDGGYATLADDANTYVITPAGVSVDASGRVAVGPASVDAIADAVAGGGTGSVAVTHNGGTGVTVNGGASAADVLRVVDDGTPIADARIVAYTAEDYEAGRTGGAYRRGTARTGDDGRWLNPINVDPGESYVFVIAAPGYDDETVEIEVAA